MNISGNTILITGGATGIGFALAEQFMNAGNTVIICGRRLNRLQEANEKLPGIHIIQCDVNNCNERENLAKTIIAQFPSLNILINNAGIQQRLNLTENFNIDLVEKEVQTNFIAPVHLTELFIDHLKRRNHPAVMNISSGLAFAPLAFMPVYCATKAALHSFSLSLRFQLAKTTIKVFEIIPPMVDTELDGGAREMEQRDRGMKADEFARQAIEAIKNDVFEPAIGHSANLRLKREEMFSMMNR